MIVVPGGCLFRLTPRLRSHFEEPHHMGGGHSEPGKPGSSDTHEFIRPKSEVVAQVSDVDIGQIQGKQGRAHT